MRRTFVNFRGQMKKGLGLLVFMFGYCHFVVAQGTMFSWDFSDCEIKDILFAVSMDTGISIVPDDTVSGKGDLKFAGGNFDLAFESFLKTNRLFVEREGSVWTVSRCRVSEEKGCYSLEAYDLLPVQIVEKLSCVMKRVVTFEALPSQKISVCFKDLSEAALMECLAKRFGLYGVEQNEAGYHFVKVKAAGRESMRTEAFSGIIKIEMLDGGALGFDVEDCRFSEAVECLFSKACLSDESGEWIRKSFCLLSDADCKIQRSTAASTASIMPSDIVG